MFDANACAIELLKMKNSEDIQQKVAVAATSSSGISEGECAEASLKISESSEEPIIPTLNPSDADGNGTLKEVTDSNDVSDHSSAYTTEVSEISSEASEDNEKKVLEIDNAGLPSSSFTTPEKSKPEESKSLLSSPSSSETPATEPEPVPSTSGASVSVSSSSNGNSTNLTATTSSAASLVSANEDGDRMATLDSSSDEEDDIYMSQFARDNMGSDNNDPFACEESVIKRNREYLFQRCTSLLRRVQGIMQNTAAKHISKQLKAVLEHPGFNPNIRNSHYQGRLSSSYLHESNSEKLTKQSLSELQFAGKLMTNIIRHSMGNQLDPDNDSATEESDSDDDEVVLPDDRLSADPSNLSECASYLPTENNPFIDAIKLEKQYEARRTSLEFSINECELTLTKSLALRKHCKTRKPLFQLKKPTASSNIINIPVDASSSVKFYHDRKPVTTRRCIFNDDDGNTNSNSSIASLDISRVSDMIQEQDKDKVKGSSGDGIPSPGSEQSSSETRSGSDINLITKLATESGSVGNRELPPQENVPKEAGDQARDQTAFIPSLKTSDTGGLSVLGVEFVNNSDPNQSSSRCSAIKRPDRNRKVFQLGGIHNIFRDPSSYPSVRCTCFGRDELCALCLGRAQKKRNINHVFMNRRDKIAILDETFHKTLSFSDDVPLEVLLTSASVEGSGPPLVPKVSNVQQLIKNRSQTFPPDFLETGPKPKKPRSYDIKPHVENPTDSPKKDGRFSDESIQSIRKRTAPRKSQSSFDDRDGSKLAGKGLGWPSRERKDSMRRTRNQEFDIDNIVIPYSIAAATRVEQLVYKPIETPRWRVLDYSEIFATLNDDKNDAELEDMSNAAFLHRHNKCEVDEKKRFTQSLQKALNATRKTRRLDSTGRSESTSTSESSGITPSPNTTLPPNETQEKSPTKPQENKEKEIMPSAPVPVSLSADDQKGPGTPVADNATVITEAMATQALKSLFKVGRRRTISTSTKPEEEEEPPVVYNQIVDPWPQRKFPLTEEDYKEMVETMQNCDLQTVRKSHDEYLHCDDSIGSPAGL